MHLQRRQILKAVPSML